MFSLMLKAPSLPIIAACLCKLQSHVVNLKTGLCIFIFKASEIAILIKVHLYNIDWCFSKSINKCVNAVCNDSFHSRHTYVAQSIWKLRCKQSQMVYVGMFLFVVYKDLLKFWEICDTLKLKCHNQARSSLIWIWCISCSMEVIINMSLWFH